MSGRCWSNSAVIDGKARLEAFINKIGVERRDLFSQKHPFIDDRLAGKGAEIKLHDPFSIDRIFDFAADDIKLTFGSNQSVSASRT